MTIHRRGFLASLGGLSAAGLFSWKRASLAVAGFAEHPGRENRAGVVIIGGRLTSQAVLQGWQPPWPGRLLDFTYTYAPTGLPRRPGFDPTGARPDGTINLWTYRRLAGVSQQERDHHRIRALFTVLAFRLQHRPFFVDVAKRRDRNSGHMFRFDDPCH